MSRSSTNGTRTARDAGFTLIEVLVGVAILAVSLTALFQAFSAGLRNVAAAEGYTTAVLLAESTLAGVGRETPLAAGETAGEWDNGFRWHLAVVPDARTAADEGFPVRAHAVAITVSWGPADEERRVSVETLRLAPTE